MNRKGYTEDYNKDKPSYKTIEIIPIPSEKKYLWRGLIDSTTPVKR